MSAWIVDRAHIDVLVLALRKQTPLSEDELGRLLWRECLASVAYRYPGDADGERPGPCDFRDDDVNTYTWTPPPANIPDVWILAAAHCYRYQSCEHPGWEASEASRLTEAIIAELEPILGEKWSEPQIPWGIDAESLAELQLAATA